MNAVTPTPEERKPAPEKALEDLLPVFPEDLAFPVVPEEEEEPFVPPPQVPEPPAEERPPPEVAPVRHQLSSSVLKKRLF